MSERQSRSGRLKRYAAEFLVVFLGVWLSLLAEQWRQGRAEAEQERLVLNAISDELESGAVVLAAILVRARTGFQAAQRLTTGSIRLESGSGELASALTALGVCSFAGIARTSRYEALRTGDLPLVRDHALRSQIDAHYNLGAQRDFLHARDCEQAEELFDLLAPWVRYRIPPLERPDAIPGWRFNDNPFVDEVLDVEGLLRDQVILDLVAKIGSQRQFLVRRLESEMSARDDLRAEILRRLGD